ncbi:MFS transporter [Pseudovibrio sp. SPO723]|uniref:MFS transporter n=1 Tax=Nesiotobacter zosterae TaxID=392721 RepID=UPI0029C47FFA|nr:MFS transporter [Pseudovibrio sp. SPO723]MDX5595686.1 MFS transporter [Pseudovibrio sp. SPO723]
MTRSNLLMALLMLTGIIVVGQLYLTIPMISAIAAEFSAETQTASWAGTAFGFAYACGFLVFGPLSDRVGRRVVLVAGLVAVGLATFLLSLSADISQFLTGRVVQGFLAASFPPVALTVIAEALPLEKRAFGISLMSFAFLIAAPLSQFFGAGISETATSIMFMLSPLYVIMAAALLMVVPRDQRAKPSAAGKPHSHLSEMFANAMVSTSWLAALTVLLGFVSFQVGTVLLAQDGGISAQTVRLAGLPPLALSLFAAYLSKRWTPSVTGRVGMVVAALGLAVAVIPGAMIAASAIISAGVALAVPGLIATIAGAAADHNRGLAMSVYTFCLFVGASVAPPLALSLSGIGTAALFGLPAAVLLIAALILTLAVSRRAKAHSLQPATGER